ncbi:T9SS type A sorting domain-containing protein [Chitinophagaceae bacterium 26-R-25]|nr:T9SS type A sorting domain-containing protein [Chitinophagaceae bacterium 26-R-25]
MKKFFTRNFSGKLPQRFAMALGLCIAALVGTRVDAQQYDWTKNGGAAASVSGAVFISPTLNATTANGVAQNATWVVFSTAPGVRYKGAGNGTPPDIGMKENQQASLGRYDANMNLVWLANAYDISKIAADPYANDQFYATMTFRVSTDNTSSNFLGVPWTSDKAGYITLVAKCKATATSSYTVLKLLKIDGSSDDLADNLIVKDIGGGHTRIVVQGHSRSTSLTLYTDGTNGAAQVVPVNGGGGVNYDEFVACYDDDNNAGTIAPLWANTFGAASANEATFTPIDIADNGDIRWLPAYTSSNSLGTVNYALNNCSGPGSGTVTTSNYAANINGNYRYIFFSLNGSNGAPVWVKNELAANVAFAPYGIATDGAGSSYVYGLLSGSGTYDAGSGVSVTAAGGNDLAVVVFDNNGYAVRAQNYGNTTPQAVASSAVSNLVNLDRTNNRLYMTGYTASGFTAGTATIQTQEAGGYSGYLLAVDATSLNGLSAVTGISSVNATSAFDVVVVRPDHNVVSVQQYTISGENRLNASATPLLQKTAYGYQDVAITKFDGSSGSLLNPVAEGGWGGSTGNTILNTALKDQQLVSVGYFTGSMVVGGVSLSNSTQAGLITLTDTATGTIAKTRALLGTSVVVTGVRVSPKDGSIYACGMAQSDITPNGGTALGKTNLGGNDVFVMKLDNNLNPIWTANIAGSSSDNAYALEIDPITGDVYVCGYFFSPTLKLNAAGGTAWGSAALATNNYVTSPVSSDVFVAKFGADGMFKWISTGGTPNINTNDGVYKALRLVNNKLYVGGYSAPGTFSFGGQSLAFNGGSTDMFLMQLDPATGNANWLKGWMGNSADQLNSIDAYSGMVYATGYSVSTSGMNVGGIPFSSSGQYDSFIFGVDASGNDLPGIAQLKGSGADGINDIKIDPTGNLFFAGFSNSSDLNLGNGLRFSTVGTNDCLVGAVDLNNNMNVKWGFLSGSVNAEQFNSVTPGKLGMLFTGGTLAGPATFGSQVINGRIGSDFCYSRITYPYVGPGAQISNLSAWYSAGSKLNGNPAAQWSNLTVNSSLTNLVSTGSVPVAAAGLNFNPTLAITGGAGYLGQGGVYASALTSTGGNYYNVYAVVRPHSATDNLAIWKETTSNTGIILGAAGNTIAGAGGPVTATNTTPLSNSQYNLSTLSVNGSTMSNYLNGTANGNATGITALNTSNAGTFQVNGSGIVDVAEVATYAGVHAIGNPSINKIETYLGIKYGITLGHDYFSTTGDTLYKVNNGFANNIAGIGIDSAELLAQKQGRSQNTQSKGDMLTIGIGTIASDNVSNTAIATQDNSYLVWGDDRGSVTTSQTTNMASTVSSCALRLPRSWRIQRTRGGIGSTQVQMDLNNTIDLSAYAARDIQLMIDKDGDGNFATGTIKLVPAASLIGNVATFNNINWDADGSGADVFAVVFNNKIPDPALVAKGSTTTAPLFTCKDVAGSNVLVDNVTTPTAKYAAVNPNGNTGYNFAVTAMNNSPAVNNQVKTDNATRTTAFANRMYVIHDAGVNNYPTGMTVRVYYDPQDSIDAVNALDSKVSGPIRYLWFKYPGTDINAVLNAQTDANITGASWLAPSVYGEEGGVKYVEFSGITSFSVFGAAAGRGAVALPLRFTDNRAAANACNVNLSWNYVSETQTMAKQFEVQRSNNGRDFETVSTISSASKTYTDMPPHEGQWYYRIKVVENSAVNYTTIMPVLVTCANDAIHVFPNPASDHVTISMTATAGHANYQLLNTMGGVVMKGNINNGVANFSVSGLSAGVYLLRIDNNGTIETQKINVMH